MKGLTKRVFSFILVLILFVSVVQLPTVQAVSASDVVSIADEQKDGTGGTTYCTWFYGKNNLQPWCAIFVSWCANQAGVPRSVIPAAAAVGPMRTGVLNGGGQIVTQPQAGDLVFYWSYDNGSWAHVGLMTGEKTSVQGNIANKVAHVARPDYYLLSGGSKNYRIEYIRPNYGGKTVEPTVTVTTTTADNITQTSAIVRGNVSVTGGSTTEMGMYFGDSQSNMTKLGSDKFSTTGVSFYYSTSKYGRTLQPGTTYYYQAYAKVGTATYYGAVKSFTTPPGDGSIQLNHTSAAVDVGKTVKLTAATTPSGQSVTWSSSNSSVAKVSGGTVTGVAKGTATITAKMTYNGKTYSASCNVTVNKADVKVIVTTKGADGITQAEATVRGEVTVSGGKATECGMYFGISSSNLSFLGSDSINANNMPFYYNTNKYGRTLSAGTTYYYRAYAVVGGETYWGEIESFTTKKADTSTSTPTTTQTPNVPVKVTTKGADGITQTEATVRGEVTVSGAKATECGMFFGTSKSNLTKLGSDSINASSMTFYYSANKYGRTLSAGTTYYYQAYAVVNGETYWGDVNSFTTAKATTSTGTVTVTTKGADNITKTSAIVRGEVTVSGAKATECGMYFGTSSSNLTFLGSDSISANNMPFYYSTSKYGRTLSAGTTYYYRAYAVVGGETHWGDVKSFTTTK